MEGRGIDIGKKLYLLRQLRGLTQEEVADRCELSKGFISQIERNLASPSITTLMDILECLGTNVASFFNDRIDEKIVFTPQDDMFAKVDGETLRGSITWLVPNAQKNQMEPIMVELNEGGRTDLLPPSEGEEFGYVLRGTVTLVVGEKKHQVRKGCAFCIHPRETHYLVNQGKTPACVLWVSNPPSF